MLRSRDRELAAIERLLGSARASRGGGLLLQGDPGIGKSAHLAAARRPVDAREPLRTALETFEPLGAVPSAERARRELRATGETAAQLIVSPRTIDHHLRSIFAKLGISSRAELIRMAAAGDLPESV